MDVYQLQIFLAVYRHRSFTAASKELHLSQPSVSIHIKKLEEELGVKLFDKVGRKTLPTHDGILLYTKAEEIIGKIGNLKSEFAGTGREVRGMISIGATGIPGSYVIPPLAAEFSRLYPEVFFHFVIGETKDISEKVLAGELLMGIVDDMKKKDALNCLHRFRDELVLVAAPGFLGKKRITPLALFKIPLLVREEGSDARQSMQKQHLLHRISLQALNIKAIMGSTDSLREAVKAGLGAAILSRFVVRDDIDAGRVHEIPIKGIKMKREFYIISHTKRALPEHYLAFLRFLKKKLPAVS